MCPGNTETVPLVNNGKKFNVKFQTAYGVPNNSAYGKIIGEDFESAQSAITEFIKRFDEEKGYNTGVVFEQGTWEVITYVHLDDYTRHRDVQVIFNDDICGDGDRSTYDHYYDFWSYLRNYRWADSDKYAIQLRDGQVYDDDL